MYKIFNYLMDKKIIEKFEKTEKINTGASGAELYFINDRENEYVLKIASQNGKHIKEYEKEYSFYKLNQSLQLPFVPKVVYIEYHAQHGIILLLKRYKPILHNEWDKKMQFRAVDLCAKLNSIPINNLSGLVKFTPMEINREFSKNSYNEWKFVLSQHKGDFDELILENIYKDLDLVCPYLNNPPQYVCHGDFHPENILMDNDNLLICDWQNIGIGKCIGDISFFISRGMGFGININSDELLDFYCERLSVYKGMPINKSALLKERYAAALLNIFSFWAYYLKDANKERVAAQYDEMVKAYNFLTSNS